MDREIIDFSAYREARLAKLARSSQEIEKKFERRNRVHIKDVILMVMTAVFYDTLQAIFGWIPYVGWIMAGLIGMYAWLTFWIWTSMKGWGVSDTVKQVIFSPQNTKKFIVKWLMPLIELVPIINIVPIWTARTIIQLAFLKAEDALYNSTGGKVDAENLIELRKSLMNEGGTVKINDIRKLSPKKTTSKGLANTNIPNKESAPVQAETEINKLKSDIDKWKAEIQKLKNERSQKMTRLNEAQRGLDESARTMRETGGLTGTMTGKGIHSSWEEGGRNLAPLSNDISKLTMRINGLENTVHNNITKLRTLESQERNSHSKAA